MEILSLLFAFVCGLAARLVGQPPLIGFPASGDLSTAIAVRADLGRTGRTNLFSRIASLSTRTACGFSRRLMLLALVVVTAGCSTTRGAPLEAIQRPIELQRFMGDWYVLAHIPIDVPLASEAQAYNGVESYRLRDDGIIETTYRFRDGGFDGPVRVLTPRGWVADETTNAEWRMQFLWPFHSAYLIAYLDEDYTRTIIGVPGRGNAWIMARTPQLPDGELEALKARLVAMGYDLKGLRIVPQRWPES
jgi:apolipoprotein D and lipocalin family protein